MQISVVAVICHSLAAISQPVCREEIVVKDDMPIQMCILSQAALANWKVRSIFRIFFEWKIARIKCVPRRLSAKGCNLMCLRSLIARTNFLAGDWIAFYL
jgi:hypothetical protein